MSSDFHWMPNLEILDLSVNEIGILHSDTFEYTSKLKIIKLAWNRLRSIGVMTFHHLKNLQKVDLTGNKYCTNETTFNGTELKLLGSDKKYLQKQ